MKPVFETSTFVSCNTTPEKFIEIGLIKTARITNSPCADLVEFPNREYTNTRVFGRMVSQDLEVSPIETIWEAYIQPLNQKGLMWIINQQPAPAPANPIFAIINGNFSVEMDSDIYADLKGMFPNFSFEKVVRIPNVEASTGSGEPPNSNTSRSRQHSTLVFCKNYIETFRGSNIPGLCTTYMESSQQSGKWSSSGYRIELPAGVSVCHVRQSFETGRYINDFSSIPAMIKSLSEDLVGKVTPAAFENFLKRDMPEMWQIRQYFLDNMAKLEAAGVEDTIEYRFIFERGTTKQGFKWLVVNGVVWNPKSPDCCPTPVVVQNESHLRCAGGGQTTYELNVPADADIEELYETDYGGDSLSTRGYVFDRDTEKWVSPASEGNTPFAGLFK